MDGCTVAYVLVCCPLARLATFPAITCNISFHFSGIRLSSRQGQGRVGWSVMTRTEFCHRSDAVLVNVQPCSQDRGAWKDNPSSLRSTFEGLAACECNTATPTSHFPSPTHTYPQYLKPFPLGVCLELAYDRHISASTVSYEAHNGFLVQVQTNVFASRKPRGTDILSREQTNLSLRGPTIGPVLASARAVIGGVHNQYRENESRGRHERLRVSMSSARRRAAP